MRLGEMSGKASAQRGGEIRERGTWSSSSCRLMSLLLRSICFCREKRISSLIRATRATSA
jgi:hypothetical protein